MLDFEEARLPFDPETQRISERVYGLVLAMLGKADLPAQLDSAAAARDLIAIIKGMIDAAGPYGETNQHALSIRVEWATFGYFDVAV